jgi:hypothetical protein
MIIGTRHVSGYASSVLSYLEENGVSSMSDLLGKEGLQTSIRDGEVVYVEMRPSNEGTRALTLSYVVQGVGIPIEVRLNPALGDSKIFLKSVDLIGGYESLNTDRFGNTVQIIGIGDELSLAREELQRLANL